MPPADNLYGEPKVGRDILAYCSRCKMELAHVIVSMLNRRAAKVLCKTCKTQHNFKRGSDTAYSAPAAPRRAMPRTSVRASELWEKKISEKVSAPIRAYKVQDQFNVGEVIQHAKFGVGLVEEVKRNGKIVVLFREGEKVMIHGAPGATL